MSRKSKPAAPKAETETPPKTPPAPEPASNDGAKLNDLAVGYSAINPSDAPAGVRLQPAAIADPVGYAAALRDGRVREINRPPIEPGEPKFLIDVGYQHPNDNAGKRWVKIELVRRDGNIGQVEEVPTDNALPAIIEKAKTDLIALHTQAIASHSERPEVLKAAQLSTVIVAGTAALGVYENDNRPEPDATNNAGADGPPPPAAPTQAPQPVTIDDILGELAAHDGSHGSLVRSPEPRLTAEQSRVQSQIFEIAVARGVPLRRQHDVYGWLLDQVAASVADRE